MEFAIDFRLAFGNIMVCARDGYAKLILLAPLEIPISLFYGTKIDES